MSSFKVKGKYLRNSLILDFSTDAIAKRWGKAAAALRAEARSGEGAALKIERKGAALYRGKGRRGWGERQPRTDAFLFIPREYTTYPGLARSRTGSGVGSVPGWAQGLPVTLRPSSLLFRKNTKETNSEKRRGFFQVRNPLPSPE